MVRSQLLHTLGPTASLFKLVSIGNLNLWELGLGAFTVVAQGSIPSRELKITQAWWHRSKIPKTKTIWICVWNESKVLFSLCLFSVLALICFLYMPHPILNIYLVIPFKDPMSLILLIFSHLTEEQMGKLK